METRQGREKRRMQGNSRKEREERQGRDEEGRLKNGKGSKEGMEWGRG